MKNIKSSIHGIFSLLLFSILVVKGIYLFELVPPSLAFSGCCAIMLLMLGMLFFRKYIFTSTEHILNCFDQKFNYIYILIGVLVSKVIPILLFDIVSIYDGSDIQVYTETAYELAHVGKAITHAGYCFSYNHIYWFSVFLSPVAKLFGISQTAFSIYLAICASISTLLIFDVLMHVMSPGKALISIVIYTLLPSQILLPQFITHEQAMLFFASIAIWLYFRFITKKSSILTHILTWVGFLFSLLCTMLVNSSGIVLSIAVCMMFWLFPGKKQHTFRNSIAKCIVVLIFLIAGNFVCAAIQTNHSDIRPDYVKSNKYLWTLFVGANVDTKASWSAEDGEKFDSYDVDANEDEIEAFRKELVINRYRELIHSPTKLIGLLKDKLTTIWALFVYPTGFANETISSKTFAAFYNRFLFKPLVLLEYAVMLILTLVHIVNLLFKRIMLNPVTVLFELYLLGMTALLLITECRNKYTISMQIIYIALCVGSIRQCKDT